MSIGHLLFYYRWEVLKMELRLQNLKKQYGAKCAVDDINVVLTPGVYGLLGANGAGKTTLMRMI